MDELMFSTSNECDMTTTLEELVLFDREFDTMKLFLFIGQNVKSQALCKYSFGSLSLSSPRCAHKKHHCGHFSTVLNNSLSCIFRYWKDLLLLPRGRWNL